MRTDGELFTQFGAYWFYNLEYTAPLEAQTIPMKACIVQLATDAACRLYSDGVAS